MKKVLMTLFVACIGGIVGFYALNSYIYKEKQAQPEQQARDNNVNMETDDVTIIPIEHASLVLEWGDSVIYADPVGDASLYAGQKKPDLILVTDVHGDHLNIDTLEAVRGDGTLIVPQVVADKLPASLKNLAVVMSNGEAIMQGSLAIHAIPMYNIPESEDAFHTKGRGNGYVLEREGKRIYISGDTGNTPELRALQDIDIAFLSMNLPYTMDVDAAAEATLAFIPKKVYPYHYRGTEGLSDVVKFKALVNAGNPDIEVVQLDWYPNQ